MLTESFPFNYMLKSKFSLSHHFEYANEQITYHFWLCPFLRNFRRKSCVGKMNGTVIANRLQYSFKIKDNNVYGSLYYWNFLPFVLQTGCLSHINNNEKLRLDRLGPDWFGAETTRNHEEIFILTQFFTFITNVSSSKLLPAPKIKNIVHAC
jgi:hypothetical protein